MSGVTLSECGGGTGHRARPTQFVRASPRGRPIRGPGSARSAARDRSSTTAPAVLGAASRARRRRPLQPRRRRPWSSTRRHPSLSGRAWRSELETNSATTISASSMTSPETPSAVRSSTRARRTWGAPCAVHGIRMVRGASGSVSRIASSATDAPFTYVRRCDADLGHPIFGRRGRRARPPDRRR